MKTPMRTRIAAAMLAGGTLVGGSFAVGLIAGNEAASAQEAEAPSSEDREARRAERAAKMEERLDAAVESGRITAEEADEIRAKIAERQATAEERRAERSAERETRAQELADSLGTTPEELRDALESGQSLADIAAANGVDIAGIIDDMVARANERIDQAVADGKIDAAKADELRANVEDKITARVNGERPERGAGFEGRRGNRGPGHRFGGGDEVGDT